MSDKGCAAGRARQLQKGSGQCVVRVPFFFLFTLPPIVPLPPIALDISLHTKKIAILQLTALLESQVHARQKPSSGINNNNNPTHIRPLRGPYSTLKNASAIKRHDRLEQGERY